MDNFKAMFSYYGSKHRTANKYPSPVGTIVEPFAGSAAYSTRYYSRDIRINDKDPIIAGIWQYIVGAKLGELLRLPTVFETLDELKVPQEAKWLIGFWIGTCRVRPAKTMTKWGNWSEMIRLRISHQSQYIKHWKVTNLDYRDLKIPKRSTCFVDPPYHKSGVYYRLSSKQIDYTDLGNWCRAQSFAIVCEQQGADWLPFIPFMRTQSQSNGLGQCNEVIWHNRMKGAQ